jgi:hypothetical protein
VTGAIIGLAVVLFVYKLAKRGLGHGLGAILLVGYVYGIVRANVLDSACHFMFDLAVAALYAERFGQWSKTSVERSRLVMPWVTLLAGWPLLLFLVPQQHPLIQLVGLRAAIYFLPFIAIGARVEARDLDLIARWVALLNLGAFGMAGVEYFVGIERFFPHNAVTDIMYRSNDIAGGAHRIPATFSSAHAYGGTMVATLPFLITRWQTAGLPRPEKAVFAASIIATAFGVFVAGPRQPVVTLFLELGVVVATVRLPSRVKTGLVVFGALIAMLVSQNERFQRFLTLRDTDYVVKRVGWSVNMTFFETMLQYPFGAGLGMAAGTSVPYFLQHLLTRPQVGMENEYGRIVLEQSFVGLALWASFITATVTHRGTPPSRDWALGLRMMRVFILVSWSTAFIGTGMLTAIPQTPLLLFQMGLIWRTRTLSTDPAAARALGAPPAQEAQTSA